ncbi:MAG: lysine--tRNA ligase [Eubacteriales bacterium]|nr:lysine--tRNA ligase [Eubacteriales bacterium]
MEEKNNITPAAEQEQMQEELNELLKTRREKLFELQREGRDPFEVMSYDVTHHSIDIKSSFDTIAGTGVSVAGRIMSKRIMGKAAFIHILDAKGTIQVYVKRDDIGEEEYARFKTFDIGDFVGVQGAVFKTRTEEISIHATALKLLSKSLRPLPEKFHGLKDAETRYRQRFVDLIVNTNVRETFIKRSRIISEIRRYLDNLGFLEVETPVLNTTASGASARPFITHHNSLDIDMYLRIALELRLKMLIVGGLERVYEIGRIFRNEGMDATHNPEFTMMELYQAYTDYKGMMELVEGLIRHLARRVLGTTQITFNGVEIDLSKPFEQITMNDAVKKYTGADFMACASDEEALELAKHIGLDTENIGHTRGRLLAQAFDQFVEDRLEQPTFVMDYPVEISPLSKRKPGVEGITERFELFICGAEYCNAFSELNDPIDQRERFIQQALERAKGDDEAMMIDEDFCLALEYGMPPTGGIGIGIDRLVMLLTGSSTIRDVLLFPTMKPLDKKQDEIKAEEQPVEAPVSEPEKIDFSKVEVEPLFQDFVDFETFSKSDFRAVKVLACEAVKKSKKLLKFTLDDGSGTERTILSGIHAYYEPEELVGKTCVAITNLPPRPMMGIESCGMLISAVHHEEGEEKLHLLMLDDHIPAGAKMY